MSALISTFEKDGKKFPTIQLKEGDKSKFGITFGVTKARLILEHFDEIRQFVDDNEASQN